jgi:hypothetical protein
MRLHKVAPSWFINIIDAKYLYCAGLFSEDHNGEE